MKHIPILLFFLITSISVAQVEFQTFDDLNELLTKAKSEKKLIHLQYQSDGCQECNEVAMMGLRSSLLKEKYQNNFISVLISPNAPLYDQIKKDIHFRLEYGSFFLDMNGIPLYMQSQTTSVVQTYIDWADKALANFERAKEWKKSKEKYDQGDKSAALLKEFIVGLRDINIYDPVLMDEYVRALSEKEQKLPNNILFMMQQGVSIKSFAYQTIHSKNDKSFIDGIWYLMDEKQRSNANYRTRYNTMNDALDAKDEALFKRLISVTYNHYERNAIAGEKTVLTMKMDYYKKVKDTINCLNSMAEMADKYLMTVDPDAKRKIAQDERDKVMEEQNKRLHNNIYPEGNSVKVFQTTRTQASDKTSMELNNFAYQTYEMTDDPVRLLNALIWSKRSLDLWDANLLSIGPANPMYMDTYAHLHYKLGRKDEAIAWMKKAVDASEIMKVSKNFKERLLLMEQGMVK